MLIWDIVWNIPEIFPRPWSSGSNFTVNFYCCCWYQAGMEKKNSDPIAIGSGSSENELEKLSELGLIG